MKNLLLFSLSFSILFACQKEQIPIDEETAQETARGGFRSTLLDYQSYIKYGQLHNDYLTNVQAGFLPSNTTTTLQEAIDFVTDFNQQYDAALTSIANEEKFFVSEQLEEYRNFVVQEDFIEAQVGTNGTFYQEVDAAYQNGSLDEFEKNALIEVGQKSYAAYNNQLSIQDLEAYFNALKTNWEAQQYTTSDIHGRTVPVIIAVSLSSASWWLDNPSAYPSDIPVGAAVPVATDVAGAAVGAVVQAVKEVVNDDVQGGGTLEGAGGRIAGAAVTGAVVGSTGAVGRVASFIKSFF